jgi:hypothetical protein
VKSLNLLKLESDVVGMAGNIKSQNLEVIKSKIFTENFLLTSTLSKLTKSCSSK